MQIENENTFLAALNNRFNLFVGAGFSSLATDNEGNHLPTGSQLGEELTQLFGLHPNLGLPQIATILNSSKESRISSLPKFAIYGCRIRPLVPCHRNTANSIYIYNEY